jgi:DNA mismatch repair ATPase MutS
MIGDMEVIHRIALHPSLQPVSFHQKKYVKMVQLVNPLIDTATPISYQLTPKRSHCLMTGPNGGGKSTVLRCILLNLVFAQTLGVCFGTSSGTYSLHPFDWIQSGLQLQDLPGQLSMFEREVEFASQALHKARLYPKQRGLVLFDELFHSTNPPDGERTAHIFLKQVWSFRHMSSFISTHVFSLAESSPSHIQKLCVPAALKDGKLQFTYRLQHGICKVSSVDLVLKKRGFFPPGKPEVVKE